MICFMASDSFQETCVALQSLLSSSSSTASSIIDLFIQLSSCEPLPASQFFYILGQASVTTPSFWCSPLHMKSSFPCKLTQRGSLLALANYLVSEFGKKFMFVSNWCISLAVIPLVIFSVFI